MLHGSIKQWLNFVVYMGTVQYMHKSYINNTLYGMSTAVMIQAIWTSTLAQVCLQCKAKYKYICIYS
jgi:hypothetical protein